MTKRPFLYNTKLSSSKYNEEKLQEKKREISHATERAILITEMLHSILKYSEIATDLNVICIPRTSLEFRKSH